ncbi:hypothetical protein ABT352_39055 [Streptosporangium sp. NPDC000563]|uniref:hypothetical protein n=1 Tax=Streptosporangium sp. NPDC000563 TaxID=3154366 RepID=UPI00332D42D8
MTTVSRLSVLDERKELTTVHVRLSTRCVGVTAHTMWRQLKRARTTGHCTAPTRQHFTIDTFLRREPICHRGNVASMYRDLINSAAYARCRARGLSSVRRAIRPELSLAERAGLRHGEGATHGFGMFGPLKEVPA